jgi:hypothetical protein
VGGPLRARSGHAADDRAGQCCWSTSKWRPRLSRVRCRTLSPMRSERTRRWV